MIPRTTLRRAALPCAFLFSWVGAPVHADWELSVGTELGQSARALHLDATLPLSGRLDTGWVQHLWLSGERYPTASGHRSVPTLGYGLGYRSGTGATQWSAALGLQYRKTPASSRAADGQQRREVGVHLEGRLQLSEDWAAGGGVDTYPASQGLALSGKLLRQFQSGLWLGPEASFERHGDTELRRFGVTLEGLKPGGGWEARLRAGAEQVDDGDQGAFFGIEFERRF